MASATSTSTSSGTDAPGSVPPTRARRRSGALHQWFRAGEVVQIVGISRRQLQYWAQTDLIRPGARTPGGHGRYTFEDLVALKTAKRLIDAGVPVQRIRKSIQALREILPNVRMPLAELVVVATGDVVLAFRDGMAIDAISGQEWVFEVADLQREVDAWRSSRRAADRPGPATGSAFSAARPPT
jgi:DNA-binding transcriptional MerR regulator